MMSAMSDFSFHYVDLPGARMGGIEVDQVHAQLAAERLGGGIDAHRSRDRDPQTLRHVGILPGRKNSSGDIPPPQLTIQD